MVLRYGAQMADGLAAAHARSITHRDLKPANVMVTRTGVKLVDFGLAKFTGSLADTAVLTEGVVGTPAYMAPEQVAGGPADTRTDIFALGLVLHEMATGKRALVAHGHPPALENVSERLAHVIERCLALDPEDRWQSAGDVRRELEWTARRPATGPSRSSGPRVLRRLAVGALVLVVAAGVGGAWWAAPGETVARGTTMHTSVPLPPGLRLDVSAPLALSPDGTTLAFVAVDEGGNRQLYTRSLASDQNTVVPGSTGASHPFFSPDSRSIAFFAGGVLQRVSVSGGTPLRVCTMPGIDQGGAWGADDTIAVSIRGRGIHTVSAAGGVLKPIEPLVLGGWPSFLPDGQTLLFTSFAPQVAAGTAFGIVSLDGTGWREILRLSDSPGEGAPVLGATAEVWQGVILPSGFLVFGQDPGFVRALPIDPRSLVPRGAVQPLASSVERGPGGGGVAFAVNASGVIMFAETGTAHQLAWVTRGGVVSPLATDTDAYRHPVLSPDGRSIAVSANDETRTPHLWLVDVARGTRTRFESSLRPAWTPDGRGVAYTAAGGMVVLRSLQGGAEVLVTRDQWSATAGRARGGYPIGWSPDGKWLLLETDPQDVWKLAYPANTLEPVLTGPSNDWGATVSPDGRAVAYVSDESGRTEVYVARWPGLDQKTPVSSRGGWNPRWSRDSRELFFWQNQALMAARVGPTLQVDTPQPLFSGAFFGAGRDASFDVSADGRFLMVKSDERAELKQITVLQHWTGMFQK